MTFDYDQIVRVTDSAGLVERRGQRAWVIAVITDRQRFPIDHLPPGVIYSVEFEDGVASDIHEADLEIDAVK